MIEFSILCLARRRMQHAIDQIMPLVDSVHLDIMDGKFVPSQAYTPEFINAFQTNLPKHVHVMSLTPEAYLHRLHGIHSFTFHVEVAKDPPLLIEAIRNRGFQVGICVNPETHIEQIQHLIPMVDRVVLMAVRPGFSGQKYLAPTSEKIIDLRSIAPDVELVIDGGMHEDTIREVMTLGATACVVCSVIVKSGDWAQKITQLRESVKIGSRNNERLYPHSRQNLEKAGKFNSAE